MSSAFRTYLLRAFTSFLRSRRWVLWKYDVETWKWTPTEAEDGIMPYRQVEGGGSNAALCPISFHLFGIVSGSPRHGALTIRKPEVEGILGREFSILFDMQLWTLSRILERVGHDGILGSSSEINLRSAVSHFFTDSDHFVIINNIGHIVQGSAIIATATILIRTGEHAEIEDYELKLNKVHVMYVEEQEVE
ncbi:hypothetical protein C8F04DRAFT_1172848 [Mycena alexandri]|uniref:Uncharacterized protein n=1 Tax=Mycena alexandri TaxID=1745969 RepID=A0AAD6TKN2_9AGAR|nr:hypothetical protein C8F04DRAFT_1172848 [Mycena alexandri]